MPSKSAAQHAFMEGIAHGMKPKSGKGPSVAVAKEFVQADTGKHFKGKRKKKVNPHKMSHRDFMDL